ncbi:MAG TPA: Wadjet anti-phage system protein JetD domain-containing protein [Gammaproteobacteria bacterium]|nr:Wadjet anti-phage system protein JetD domain-containing protein [Gammaproteobacteria bacterium]
MAKAFLLEPPAALEHARRRYRNQSRNWLAGGGDWPLSISLGLPSEREALKDLARVRDWQNAWTRWRGPGEVEWVERQWPNVGAQHLPQRLILATPEAVADATGDGDRWRRAAARFRQLVQVWPALREILPRHYALLADWNATDFDRLRSLLQWLIAHPASALYPRQLPVAGLDSKWLDTRRAVVGEWLSAIRHLPEDDFYALAGLCRPPITLRMRLLDPELRQAVGGLSDMTAPVSDLAQLRLPVRKVFIVENLQTGLAFEELPGAVVFMRQGYAVNVYADLPWLMDVPCYYWGDLDTHGFAILNRLRQYLPHARSLLMDEGTLLDHRALWSREATPAEVDLPILDAAEAHVYDKLRYHHWGHLVRLEQERIAWPYAWERVRKAGSV